MISFFNLFFILLNLSLVFLSSLQNENGKMLKLEKNLSFLDQLLIANCFLQFFFLLVKLKIDEF